MARERDQRRAVHSNRPWLRSTGANAPRLRNDEGPAAPTPNDDDDDVARER